MCQFSVGWFRKLLCNFFFQWRFGKSCIPYYLKLTSLLKSWDNYRRPNFVPLISPNQMLPSSWRLRLVGKWLPRCLIYLVHDKMDSKNKSTIDNENIPFTSALTTNKSTKINRILATSQWGKWASKALEKTMDVVDGGQMFLRKISKFWHIPWTCLLNHLNGKTSSM